MVQPNNPIVPVRGETVSRNLEHIRVHSTLDISGVNFSGTEIPRLNFLINAISQFSQPIIIGENIQVAANYPYLAGGFATVSIFAFIVEHPDTISISNLGPVLNGHHGFVSDGTNRTTGTITNNVALFKEDLIGNT